MKAETYTWSQVMRVRGSGQRRMEGFWGRWAAIIIVFLWGLLSGCGQRQDRAVPASEAGRASGIPGEATARAESVPPPHVETRAPGSKLPLYELTINPNELTTLDAQSHSTVSYSATFHADGRTYEGVKVRLRGRWSRLWPKKSLEIVFDKDHSFGGRHNLNLNSAWRDPAFVREAVAYHVYARCGAATLLSRMVRLDANGKFRGLYVEVEQPDKTFVNRLNLKGASAYKSIAGMDEMLNQGDERDHRVEPAYKTFYRKETQKNVNFQDLHEFCHRLARATNVLEFFEQRVDLEKYINYLAATVLTQNYDCFNKNHILVYDGKGSQKWFKVPWDLDRTLGDHWEGWFDEARLPLLLGTRQCTLLGRWNRMEDRFFNERTLRRRFADRLEALMRAEFTPQKLNPLLDQLEIEIEPEAELDRRRWPKSAEDLHTEINRIKQFIVDRRTFLMEQLPKLRAAAAQGPKG